MRKGLILPAGEYYIGDPCYLFGKSWDDILEVTNVFENDVDEYKNHKFFVGNTAYGDGEYYDRNGHPYPVDSGLIGVFPIKVIEIDNHIKLEEILEYGNLVTFKPTDDGSALVTDMIGLTNNKIELKTTKKVNGQKCYVLNIEDFARSNEGYLVHKTTDGLAQVIVKNFKLIFTATHADFNKDETVMTNGQYLTPSKNNDGYPYFNDGTYVHRTVEDFEEGTDIFMIERFNTILTEATNNFTDKSRLKGDNLQRVKCALPEGFLQTRLFCINYKTLRNMILQRHTHALKQWHYFISEIYKQAKYPEFLPNILEKGV